MQRFWIMLAVVSLAVGHAEWQPPVNIGSAINSDSNDWYPAIARDGSFVVFVSERPGGHGSSDLWISTRDSGQWQAPRNLGPQVNTPYCESAPYLTEGDSVLYFASMAPGGEGGMDIYWCNVVEGVAGPKQNFGPPVNSGALDCCPVISGDGSTIYFCSTHAGGYGSMDVWMSAQTELGWSEPVNLGPSVNSAATDCPRWLSDDGMTMLVCSTRGEGNGDADMWVSQKAGNTWGPLTNMGTVLNSSAAEWGASFLHNDGNLGGTIFFGSGRSGGHGGLDIWYAEEVTDADTPAPKPGIGLSLFPNPSRTGTTVIYTLAEAARVVIAIHDIQGRLARVLADRYCEPGTHATTWDMTTTGGGAVPAGTYWCTVNAGEDPSTERMIVVD